jgi:CheY-like chemotaxis protein
MDDMKRILVIEDDPSQRQLFKTALENAGYKVSSASNGEEGLQLYRQQPCDLIITDIFMPKEDGIATIFDLKTHSSHVKIVAISGGGSWTPHGRKLEADEPLEMATHFGADRTLKKPIKIHHLLAVVDELLHRKNRSNVTENSRVSLSKEVSQKRILVIEDDVSQRQFFKTVLENAGYTVLEASDGQVGLELYRQQPCDLIITDIFMPKEDGIETIFDLRSHYSYVKIIAISGGGSWSPSRSKLGADDPLEIAKHFGADRTLKKPVKTQRLLAMIDDLLNVKGRLH